MKQDLLAALSSRNVKEIASMPVPSAEEIDRVEFGLAVDRKDYKKGFRLLREKDLLGVDDEDLAGGRRGKGKAGRKTGSVVNNTVAGAGLKEGDVIAFRFKTVEEVEKQQMKEDGEDEDMLDGLDAEDEGSWNVVFPSYDEDEE